MPSRSSTVRIESPVFTGSPSLRTVSHSPLRLQDVPDAAVDGCERAAARAGCGARTATVSPRAFRRTPLGRRSNSRAPNWHSSRAMKRVSLDTRVDGDGRSGVRIAGRCASSSY